MANKAIIHVDMDAFYASIEQRDNPKLRNKPIAVGGNPNSRGVVSTASYEARKYGVKSAMSCKKAKILCPELIIVPVNKEKYKRVSKKLHKIFRKFSDKIEPISLDEAFIDVTGSNPIIVAKEIKKEIKQKLRLTASVGISNNKFLAKLASDMEKPDGFTVINKNDVEKILDPLPVRKLWGVGPKTEEQLNKLGIYKIKDLKNYDKNILIEKFGKKGIELIEFSKGIDNRPVEWRVKSQSIGEENTFSKDVSDINILRKAVNQYALDITKRIKKSHYLIKTVTVKIKYEDFTVETRSLTLKQPTDKLTIIRDTAHYILDNKFNIKKKVRLLGLTVSNFVYPNEPIQLRLDIDEYMRGTI
ncbi:DNA polymerase IV [Caldisalinibacter kiritimatiensis]|uniref:DNA polymerase IV n=1 Tax=Caldisalinibacter kiritimatiensis TaxID=1304284 RepID=R1AT83_9FIRM|nr:DNA polymerase IV [Caldisalinibacter kiritimatiensis]EOC99846.1 DNA polymerase IV [Caldisalinibacter kiritimatiensis]